MAGVPRLEGVFVPPVTPFDERGEVDLACIERLAAECLDAGAAGIVALATSLTDDERKEIVAACARVCQDRSSQLLVGAHETYARVPYACQIAQDAGHTKVTHESSREAELHLRLAQLTHEIV